MTTYDKGDQARLSVAFTNISGAAADPTDVTLQVISPSRGPAVEYTYDGGEITRTGTGAFYKDLSLTEAGIWSYKWIATGAIVAAEEGELFVQSGAF